MFICLSFAKNMSKNISANLSNKDISNKNSQRLIVSAKKSTTDAIKNDSKSSIQKTAEANDDLIGNKVADKRTSVKNHHRKI